MSAADSTTDRQGLEVIEADECWILLGGAELGRVAFIDAGAPLILPVNHVVMDDAIYFRSARGTKLGAAMMAEPVAFEVDGIEDGSGWSVLVRGAADIVYEPRILRALEATGLRPWADEVQRPHWVKILVSEVTGRRIPAPEDPAEIVLS